jgi:hypothetical protein
MAADAVETTMMASWTPMTIQQPSGLPPVLKQSALRSLVYWRKHCSVEMAECGNRGVKMDFRQ